MSPQTLNREQAISAGSDLWIIPNREVSSWSIKLDWYMNFQLAKVLVRNRSKVSPQLVEWASQAEVTTSDLKVSDDSPILIHTNHILPNNQVLHVPFTGNIGDWMKRISAIWIELGKPKSRIFLPDEINVEAAANTKTDLAREATFVRESL